MSDRDMSSTKIPHKNGIRRGFQILDIRVYSWTLQETESNGILPSRKRIQNYALKVYRDAGYPDFKASLGWYRRWQKRHELKKLLSSTVERSKEENGHDVKHELQMNPSNAIEKDFQKFSSSVPLVTNDEGIFLNQSIESFSSETDKLISNIDMINSPSELFNFSDSFDKSMDSLDLCDSLKNCSNPNSASTKNFMKELMDDFGKYCSESEKKRKVVENAKFIKKSCKYDDDFKKKVIQYFNEHCIKDTAIKFNIHPNTTSVWLKDDNFQKHLNEITIEKKIENRNNNEAIKRENDFLEWLLENEKNNVIVSKLQVESKISDLLIPGEVCRNSYWFMKYCHRYVNRNGTNNASKIRYSDRFQISMVNYANKTSQIKTASVFNLARKQLFNWMKNNRSEKLTNKQQADRKLIQWYDSCIAKPSSEIVKEKAKLIYHTEGIDLACSNSWYYNWCSKNKISVKRNCDEEIVKWILESYDQNLSISHHDVQKKALEIYRSHAHSEFKASAGWLLRFCRRYMNLLRRIPALSAELPIVCEKNVENFLKDMKILKLKYHVDVTSLGVMDELFLKLKPPGVVDNRNKKTLLRNCGMNNAQGTVILSCLADGQVLPPLLVLKDKNIDNESKHCLVFYQPYGVVDSNVLLFWLKNIWFRYTRSPNMLLVDCFAPHNDQNIKEYFAKQNSCLRIIPRGCSSKLSPLSQTIRQSFQECVDENCKKWFDTNYSWQIGGGSYLFSSQDIISWVEDAHNSITTASMKENVKSVFREMNLISVVE